MVSCAAIFEIHEPRTVGLAGRQRGRGRGAWQLINERGRRRAQFFRQREGPSWRRGGGRRGRETAERAADQSARMEVGWMVDSKWVATCPSGSWSNPALAASWRGRPGDVPLSHGIRIPGRARSWC